MNDQEPSRTVRRYAIGCFVVVALLAVVAFWAVDYAIKAQRRAARTGAAHRIHQQIADVKSGKQDIIISLSNEVHDFEFTEFLKYRKDFGQADSYELWIWYSHNVDNLLGLIAGIRGVRSLVLCKTDVSDAGIEFVATMPELREVKITKSLRTTVTSEKLAELCARLPQCTIELGVDQ